jgi:hypothetical protein
MAESAARNRQTALPRAFSLIVLVVETKPHVKLTETDW